MKTLIKITALLLIITIFQSCTDRKQEVILDFLNKTEVKFDKATFEYVDLKCIDTIYEIKRYKYSDFKDYPKIDSEDLVYDTVAVNDFIQKDVYWLSEPYSKEFYDFLRYNGDDSGYTLRDGKPNLFLNRIVETNYDDFRIKLIDDAGFQNSLKNEIKQYDYFKGVFSSDSLLKFIYINSSLNN